MTDKTYNIPGSPRRQKNVGVTIFSVWLLLLMAFAADAATVSVNVVSAADGATPVGHFKYIINIDNTGTTVQRSPAAGCSPASPGYPDSCNWVSVAGRASQ